MILVGRYVSPFARRTAVVLQLMGLDYEHRELSTAQHGAEIRGFNPVGRVPALELDDGDVLIDSGAIIDYLNEIAPPGRQVIPASGLERRQVLKLTAIGHAAAEKVVALFYERTRRPQEKVFEDWAHALENQIHGGLDALDQAAEGRDWLVGDALTLADITAVCAYDAVRLIAPALTDGHPYPHLTALAGRCNAMPAFAETAP